MRRPLLVGLSALVLLAVAASFPFRAPAAFVLPATDAPPLAELVSLPRTHPLPARLLNLLLLFGAALLGTAGVRRGPRTWGLVAFCLNPASLVAASRVSATPLLLAFLLSCAALRLWESADRRRPLQALLALPCQLGGLLLHPLAMAIPPLVAGLALVRERSPADAARAASLPLLVGLGAPFGFASLGIAPWGTWIAPPGTDGFEAALALGALALVTLRKRELRPIAGALVMAAGALLILPLSRHQDAESTLLSGEMVFLALPFALLLRSLAATRPRMAAGAALIVALAGAPLLQGIGTARTLREELRAATARLDPSGRLFLIAEPHPRLSWGRRAWGAFGRSFEAERPALANGRVLHYPAATATGIDLDAHAFVRFDPRRDALVSVVEGKLDDASPGLAERMRPARRVEGRRELWSWSFADPWSVYAWSLRRAADEEALLPRQIEGQEPLLGTRTQAPGVLVAPLLGGRTPKRLILLGPSASRAELSLRQGAARLPLAPVHEESGRREYQFPTPLPPKVRIVIRFEPGREVSLRAAELEFRDQ